MKVICDMGGEPIKKCQMCSAGGPHDPCPKYTGYPDRCITRHRCEYRRKRIFVKCVPICGARRPR